MNPQDWLQRCDRLLSRQRELALFRRRWVVHPIDATHVQIDGRRMVNFAGNDYLGLTHHPKMIEAVCSSQTSGVGSGAAGLITGYTDLHQCAEEAIAKWKGTEAAVILPSGYQANVAAIQTLAAIGESYAGGVRFILDKLAHASLIDAVRATGAEFRIFPHNQLSKLKRLLEQAGAQQLQVVLTESIFSMDGDAADLPGLAKLKKTHDFVLLLDEAHGSGVFGPAGAGLAAELGLTDAVDISIVTLSKAMGCAGGAVGCSTIFRDALLNFGRAYIYSTSVPPMIPAALLAAIEVMRNEPHRQQRVRMLAARVREACAKINIPPGNSPIIPIVLGSPQAAMDAAEQMKQSGMLVVAVRPPTVPRGASRVRVTLSCEHTDDEVEDLIASIRRLRIVTPG